MTSPGTTNLLAWWSLDEESGTRADSHSGGHNMSLQGTPSYTTGIKGNAGTISVTSGAGSYFYYVDSGNALDCPSGSSLTVCCWVYFNSLPTNNAYPVNRWGDGSGSNKDWAFNVYSTGAAEAVAAHSTQQAATTATGVISAGAWYFLTLIYDHTVGSHGRISIAVNNGTAVTAALTAAKVAGSGIPVSIGDLSHTSAAYGTMSGAVDEVCVYQRVLTGDELTWLYNSGAGRAYGDLSALYQQAVAGTLTSAGVVVIQTGKVLAGAVTSAGAVARLTGKPLAGALTSSGNVIRHTARLLEGAVSNAGSVAKSVGKALAGALSSSGTVATVWAGVVTGLIHLTARVRAFALRVREN